MLNAPCAAALTAAISFKSNETDVPAQPHQTQAHSRLPRPHGDESRPAGLEEASKQGAGKAVALVAAIGGLRLPAVWASRCKTI